MPSNLAFETACLRPTSIRDGPTGVARLSFERPTYNCPVAASTDRLPAKLSFSPPFGGCEPIRQTGRCLSSCRGRVPVV
jgi:hypothetical protein